MNEQLNTQLAPIGAGPPSKRPKLDSVNDGADFNKYLEELPDDLLVTNLDLPALDGATAPDLGGNITNLNSSSQLQGLNSSQPPPNSQPLPAPTSSPLKQPPQVQPQPQKTPPQGQGALGVPSPVPGFNTQSTPSPSSTSVALYNNTSIKSGLTSTAGVPSPGMVVVSTTADPTPALPNVSSSPATHYVSSSLPALPTHSPRPPASANYSYPSYMTSPAPGASVHSQVNIGHAHAHPHHSPQQPQVNYIGTVRHPGTSNPHMAQGMLPHQQSMMSMRPRGMVPGMANPHVQQPGHHMAMGGVMQSGHAAVGMHPGMGHQNYSPRGGMMPGMMQGVIPRSGMTLQHRQQPLHMRMQPQVHPAMHNPAMVPGMRQGMSVTPHGATPVPQHYMDPTYQGQMRGGYSLSGQPISAMSPSPHPAATSLPNQMVSHSQPMPQPVGGAGMPGVQSLPGQPSQQPRPPSNGLMQSSPISSQLQPQGMMGGPVVTPSQHPPPQATPPPSQGVTPPMQNAVGPTSRPATPQQQQTQPQQGMVGGPPSIGPPSQGPLQRSSPQQGPPSLPPPNQQTVTLQHQPSPQRPPQTPQQHQQQQQQPPTPQPTQQQNPQQAQQQTPQQAAQQQQQQQQQPQGLQQASPAMSQPPNSLPPSSIPGQLQSPPVGGAIMTGPQNQVMPQGSQGYSPNMMAPGGVNMPPAGQHGTSDPEKRKLIQQQLVLLLHAHKCQRREKEQSMGGADYQPCSLPHCRTMKMVLNHMTECPAGRQCTYPHCASSRQIITHWKNCQKPDCPVCLPLKNASLPRKREDNQTSRPNLDGIGGTYPYQGPGGQMSPSPQHPRGPITSGPPNHTMRQDLSISNISNSAESLRRSAESLFGSGDQDMSGLSLDMAGMNNQNQVPFPVPIPTIPNQPTQPWHQQVQSELRQHLVKKLVEAIYPIQNPNALQDTRVSSLITYAMKVEKAMFETASSREEYYQRLAEKIYRIRKELEERRKIRVGIDIKKRGGEGSGVPSSPTIPNGGENMSVNYNPYFGGSGGGPRSSSYSMDPSPYSQPPSSQPTFSAQSHCGSPSIPPSSVEGSVPSVPSTDLLPPVDSKKDILTSSSTTASSKPPLSPSSSSLPKAEVEVKIKTEIRSPSSIRAPWSRQEAPPTETSDSAPSDQQQSLTSVTPAHTPRESVSSVKSRTGVEALPEPPPPPPPRSTSSSRPATPSKPMDTNITTPTVSSKLRVQPDPALRKVFTQEELVEALLPVLEQIYSQDPESFPFMEPVDPKALGIPDYFDIIGKPMDLKSIRNKLTGGDYSNPWEFCKDIWLMFDNAWVYNKKTSRVYKYCTKLSEVFDMHINTAMIKLGYCCGMRYTFHPQVLYCYGRPLCTIPRDTAYYGYQNRYIYCQKCFSELPGDTVTVGDDPSNTTDIAKTAFKELKNDHVDYEPMVECIHCGRKFHTICVLYHAGIWNEGYQCDGCLLAKGTHRRENKFCAKRLPTNKLSLFLEERVNVFLQNMDSGSEVSIRVVSSFDKVLETRTLMRDRFQSDFPEQFPYRTKAMFVFEEIEGHEVCFFGLHVQEYGSDCQAPNTRRVYISYLDSIHFFQPRHLRTLVYHEILIGYLQFCKNNGFLTAHIWACPPSEGDDYIFHCHPPEQKIPKPKRLVEWYRKMLDRGKSDNVVFDYRDIFKHCTEDGITSVTEIPYFEGDFWPNIMEDTIKELDQEAREREASEAATGEGRGPKKAGKRNTNKKGSKKAGYARKSGKASNMMIRGDDLSQKIYQTMDKHKEVFFVVLLQPPPSCSSPMASTTDPDPLIPCDLMDGRDAFLTLAREKHWEFSSLRRAKASTQAMLYELHNQGSNFIYSCNGCGRSVETRFHCRECDDFDLCCSCYETTKHEHPMDKLGLGVMDPDDQDTTAEHDPQARRNATIQRAVEALIHASQCKNAHCKSPSCIRMKRVLRHTRDCRLRTTGNCYLCKQFLFLVYSHAKNCKDANCPVGVICKRVKANIQETRAQQRRRNDLLLQQRIRSMHRMTSTNGASQPAKPGAVGGANSPARTSPPTSRVPPTPPQKGSPATHAPSPAGPQSVGKGGPRTPAKDVSGGKGGKQRLLAPSPATPKPEWPMAAPNVAVAVNPVPMVEEVVHRVPQPSGAVPGGPRDSDLLNVLLGTNIQEKEKVKLLMERDPELKVRLMALFRQRQQQHHQQQLQMQQDMVGIPPDISPHQPMLSSYSPQRQVPSSMMAQRPQAASYQPQPQPQLMRAMPAQVHHNYTMNPMASYRPASYHTPMAPMMPPHPSYQQQQPHHSSQLSRMLTQRPGVQPQYPSPPNPYSQMQPSQQPVGPPPHYSMRVPPQPQTAGYPHMLGHSPQQMPAHNTMKQHMGPGMQAGHTPQQFGPAHQQMQVDPRMPADGNFYASSQQPFSLNASNNNNLPQAMYLTPEDRRDRLSKITDLL